MTLRVNQISSCSDELVTSPRLVYKELVGEDETGKYSADDWQDRQPRDENITLVDGYHDINGTRPGACSIEILTR